MQTSAGACVAAGELRSGTGFVGGGVGHGAWACAILGKQLHSSRRPTALHRNRMRLIRASLNEIRPCMTMAPPKCAVRVMTNNCKYHLNYCPKRTHRQALDPGPGTQCGISSEVAGGPLRVAGLARASTGIAAHRPSLVARLDRAVDVTYTISNRNWYKIQLYFEFQQREGVMADQEYAGGGGCPPGTEHRPYNPNQTEHNVTQNACVRSDVVVAKADIRKKLHEAMKSLGYQRGKDYVSYIRVMPLPAPDQSQDSCSCMCGCS